MEADTKKLRQIFLQPIQYCVPLFQRPYVWKEEDNWEPLWEDIRLLADDFISDDGVLDRTHFIGAIVVEQIRRQTGNLDMRQVIDGQQRLTTLQVILCVCRNLCTEYNLDAHHGFFQKFTQNDNTFTETDQEQYKVWPTNYDRDTYAYVCSSTSEDIKNRNTNPDPGDSSLLLEAYVYFYERIEEWINENRESEIPDNLSLNALRNVLDTHLLVVVIDLNENDDAQVIFETLNARGQQLLPGDLIKNFLFHKVNVDEHELNRIYKDQWEDLDDGFWREEIQQGRLKRPRFDIFLQHYLSLKTAKTVNITQIFQTYKKLFVSCDYEPVQAIGELNTYRQVIRVLFNPAAGSKIETFIKRLRILETNTVYPYLLEIFNIYEPDSEELNRIIDLLESYLVRRALCNSGTKNYNKYFTELVKSALEANDWSPEHLERYLATGTKKTTIWPSDETIISKLVENTLYYRVKQSRINMVLRAIEKHLTAANLGAEGMDIPEDLSIEHLMPDKWPENWPIDENMENKEEFIATRNRLINTIGNLTLLTQPFNTSISNGAWSSKKPEIVRQSQLTMNGEFIDIDEWDEECIKKRSRRFAEIICTLWPASSIPAEENGGS